MAMLFPYLELIASLFILLLAFEILTRHYGSKLARFYTFFALIAFLAAILTYSLRIAFTLELARDINRLSATLWAFLFALYAHFALLYTKKENLLKKPAIYFLLYLPPALIGALFLFTNQMYLRHEIQPFGIAGQPAPLYLLFVAETAFFCGWGIWLFFRYAHSAPQKIERTQALLIALGSLIPVSIGIFTDQILPLIVGYRLLPPTVVIDVALMNFFIFIAMRRYSLFAISPALAAETIIETMPDSLLVTDLEGRVLLLNEEAHKFFHVPKKEILGHPVVSLFKQKEKYDWLYNEVVNKNICVERFEAELIDPLGEVVPALINACLLREKVFAEVIGIVLIIRDVRG
jgi:PAS domain S-box-containing protein